MDIRDLRIGNLFTYGENTCYVSSIFNTHFNARNIKTHVDYGDSIRANFEPIQLTEELLLKCGFYHNEKIEYRLHCPEFPITIDIDDFGIQISDSWEFGSIQYLHELQNLYYALTKTEIIINL